MKSLYTTRFGGPEVLEVRNDPDPVPGPGQLLMDVQRAGLNFADVAARVGLYPDAPKPPMVMGYEAAGTVASVGPEVNGFRVGERVMAIPHFRGQANRVLVSAEQAIRMPSSMTFEQAAALPVNYLTAFHMLHRVGHLLPKSRVLIHMAAGGVGLAAIQLCRQVEGVELFGTASASKHAVLRESGLHHPIDYHSVDYADEVRRLTGGRGVDLVLDPLGGKDWEKGYRLLAPAGQLIAFGWANMVSGPKRNFARMIAQFMSMKRYSPMELMDHNRTVSGVNIGHLWNERDLLNSEIQALMALFEQGKVAPRVDRVFPLTAAAEAHRYIQERKNIGKVVFDCTQS